MFDTETFLRGLAEQCDTFNLKCKGVWEIASGIFVVELKEPGDQQSFFTFYYDTLDAKYRDRKMMSREAQLLAKASRCNAFHCKWRLIPDEDSAIEMFHFEIHGACPVGTIKNARDYAMQFLVLKNSEEILWFENPEELRVPAIS